MQAVRNDEEKRNELQDLWSKLADRVIKGKISQYKINRGQFLGRGGFGIVYGGLRKTPTLPDNSSFSFQEVAIKQFKKSEKWRHEEDQDKEVLLLSKYGSMLQKQYVLQVIEIFQEKETQRYFLITPLAKGGNLCQRMKGKIEQQDVYQFALRLSRILKYIHFQALANFRSKQRGQEQKQRIAIIHRDVKPQNIVFTTRDNKDSRDMKGIYLLDFGIAKIGYTQYFKGYNNCGTSYYKAPEIGEGRIYNAKVDIYSFGCTLYELINDGQKLITSAGIGTRYGDRQRFIRSKLIDLHLKLLKSKKFKSPGYWIKLLNECLTYQIKKRYDSQELYDFLKNNHYMQSNYQDKTPFYGQLADKDKEVKVKRQIFEINFEMFRLSIIQDVIFAIFQYVYFEQPRISKFTLYTILKFIVLFFTQRYGKVKERCKNYQKKSYQLKAAIEQRKIFQLKQKAHSKMEKEIDRQRNNDLMQNKKNIGPNQDIIRRYPELMNRDTSEPKRILYEFCYQKKTELLQNEKLARFILTIISYMQDFDSYEEIKIETADLDNTDVEVLSVKRLHLLKKYVDDKLAKDGLKNKLDCCRVEGSLKSNINKQENKTDLDIERI